MTKDRPEFKIGDIVFDIANRDVGVLLRRYFLFKDSIILNDDNETIQDLIVWDIFWTGPNLWAIDDGVQTYTEEGLYILWETGVLELFANI
mgnify:CR=1 FL=1